MARGICMVVATVKRSPGYVLAEYVNNYEAEKRLGTIEREVETMRAGMGNVKDRTLLPMHFGWVQKLAKDFDTWKTEMEADVRREENRQPKCDVGEVLRCQFLTAADKNKGEAAALYNLADEKLAEYAQGKNSTISKELQERRERVGRILAELEAGIKKTPA